MPNKFTQGSLLLMSLLATASILAGVGLVSTLLVRELSLSKNLDFSTMALYGAEGALENAIYDALVLGKSATELPGTGQYPSTPVSWEIKAENKTNQLIIDRIAKNAFITLNLYNQDQLANPAAGIGSLMIKTSFGNSLEATVSDWDGSSLTPQPAIALSNCAAVGCPLNAPDPVKGHKVVLKALVTDALDVKITAWTGDSGSGTAKDVPLPVTITATGWAGQSKQALNVNLKDSPPWE